MQQRARIRVEDSKESPPARRRRHHLPVHAQSQLQEDLDEASTGKYRKKKHRPRHQVKNLHTGAIPQHGWMEVQQTGDARKGGVGRGGGGWRANKTYLILHYIPLEGFQRTAVSGRRRPAGLQILGGVYSHKVSKQQECRGAGRLQGCRYWKACTAAWGAWGPCILTVGGNGNGGQHVHFRPVEMKKISLHKTQLALFWGGKNYVYI